MYKTLISAWVPIDLVSRLDEMARERNVSRQRLVGNALSVLVLGKPLEPLRFTGRDGREDEARNYVEANVDKTVTALIAGLADLGITRRKTWVTEARLAVRRVAP